MAQNYGLGRGLASLIPQKNDQAGQPAGKISEPKDDFNYFGAAGKKNDGVSDPSGKNNSQEVDIIRIVPNPHQPRLHFDAEKLQELANSIKEHGIIQPLVLAKNGNEYQIIAGERRLQAAKIAGLNKVPAIIRDATEQQKLELAVIENVQRHDLNPVEEAKSYVKLASEFDLGQEEIALRIGKSRSAIANKIRLLNLPVEIQRALIEGKITEGHAKAILAIDNPEKQRALFELILKNNLTVRQTENKTKEISVRTHKRIISVDPEIRRIENDLSQALGTKVKLSKSGSGGRIIVDYYSQEELENLISKLC